MGRRVLLQMLSWRRLSVCRSVALVHRAKAAGLNEMPFGSIHSCGLK